MPTIDKKIWVSDPKVKCLILCGGRGTRLLPLSRKNQKSMIEVNGRPILRHVLDYWKPYSNDFIFVVKYKKKEIIDYVRTMEINAQFVEPDNLTGIADGIYCARDYVSDRFIVVLSDCVCNGEFIFPEKIKQGIGVRKTENAKEISKSYEVFLREKKVCKVIEKPSRVMGDLCGLGFYFFNRSLFKYIEVLKPSKLRGEKEITDAIQLMIEGGEDISPVFFRGGYVNISTLEDLGKAERVLSE